MQVNFDFPGLCKETTAAGNVRWRVRVDGEKRRKITIPVGPVHPDFQEHYDAARLGEKLKQQKTQKPEKGTLDELREHYVGWMEIQVQAGNLSQLTFASRRRGLQQACDCRAPNGKARMGEVSATLPLAAFGHIRDSFDTRTGAAATCLKALRAAYKWGSQRGFPEDSPVFRVENTHVSKGGATPWTKEDKKKFLKRHGAGTMARRWFRLVDDTAGRIDDTRLLGPQHAKFRGDQQVISWQPGKSGSSPVEVPMSAELMCELAGLPEDAPAYLLTEWGKPFASSGSLDNRVRKWIIEAGLYTIGKNKKGEEVKKATRSQHGIRKACAEEIAEQGGSVYEVMSVLSHSDEKTAAIYTKRFERAQLAIQAAERRKKAN
ncbi:site-specific integrase [Phaeobacter gallaeciensis]|uniref:Site-specific integrase n=2 Tax=Roseobacteraceae TaxID=2854170 RepID=A0A366WNI1_9RHOB|nr:MULTISPECIES: site-specific integrase [Roseobacteraceae]MBT3139788.1 site-specific integrase [Falsiruegeria litorea]MBT8167027.1 site-specific integrase [Falsiruegeria litorea]RBW49602.1 site-specific integrase [Phaeobacter gallaeciensis]